jgi:hypothetical protein
MKEKLIVPGKLWIFLYVLIGLGLVTLVSGFITDRLTTWAVYLVVNYYFFSLAMGGAFFLVLQSISQSGWSSAFRRIPEAMMMYVPVAALFFLLLWFGMNDLYKWSDVAAVKTDELIQHKAVFLNIPFFFGRMIIYFGLWIFLIFKLRQFSLLEDKMPAGDTEHVLRLFDRYEMYSKIFIFISAITFSLSAIDWVMSIDVKWYSTIFALKNLVAAFLHGVSVITLIVFILYHRGYFPFLNKYHLHDFARYIFMFSIIWGYFWFAQFMIIWYGNIPEETVYFSERWQEGWKLLFYLEIGLNWFVPFMVLLPVKTSRNMNVITAVICVLIIGQLIDLIVQVVPGSVGAIRNIWIYIGIFLGYAGLFTLVLLKVLASARLIPANHPYLVESLEHKF